jgi:putative endonuclease
VRQYYVYILASHSRCIYVGVTNDLTKRLYYHRSAVRGFVAKYRVYKLVYFETHRHPMNAIAREKQIKGWVRRKKIDLIERAYAGWLDLAAGWLDARHEPLNETS